MRIAKAMARAGLCSRRDAEQWIAEGRVAVNGQVLETPATIVGPRDRIEIDGAPMPAPEPARLWRFHKPKGCVTSARDPEGRPTVFDHLPKDMPRVVTIGRLDFNTEGLLLLTTDGELARHLELPSTGWLRRYRVRAFGRVSQDQLDALKDGVTIDGVAYGPIEATLDSEQGHNVWLTVGLREGKNREVRNILAHLGLTVNRLIRVSFGPFQLMDLAEGAVDHVRRRVLCDQLGPSITEALGLTPGDDDAPVSAARAPHARPRAPAGETGLDRPPPRSGKPATRAAPKAERGDAPRSRRPQHDDAPDGARPSRPPSRPAGSKRADGASSGTRDGRPPRSAPQRRDKPDATPRAHAEPPPADARPARAKRPFSRPNRPGHYFRADGAHGSRDPERPPTQPSGDPRGDRRGAKGSGGEDRARDGSTPRAPHGQRHGQPPDRSRDHNRRPRPNDGKPPRGRRP